MSDSYETAHCPSCGREIPVGAPQGICPRCLLAGAAGDGDGDAPLSATRTAARRAMEMPSLAEMRRAFPQFEIIELIGSGGMGAVFKARQPKLDRLVALKVLPQALAADERFAARFLREAKALARLNHPNIVAVYDFGQSPGGEFFYLLMEHVDGANLRQAMRAGRFSPQQAFAVVPEICAALQYAHDEGVLHRDIKPENLLLDTAGRLKIVDFGIAKLLGEDADAEAALTGSLSPGTPQYMAPEQVERTGGVDHRADIYSLGVVFYEMLTGELPIGRFAPPSEKSRVGTDVDEIVFRSLEKEPDRRQQSAGEVKTQVEGIADRAGPPPPGYDREADSRAGRENGRGALPATRPSRGHPLRLLITSLVVIGLFWGATLLIAGYYKFKEREANQALRAEEEVLKEQAFALQRQARSQLEESGRSETVTALESEAAKLLRKSSELFMSRRATSEPHGVMAVLLFAGILITTLFGLPAVAATVAAWRLLQTLRMTGEPRGRLSALIAALFLPVLAGSAIVFLVFVAPARGAWVGPSISLSILAALALSVWMVWRTWRWLKQVPGETQRAQWQHHLRSGAPSWMPGKKTVGWLCVLLILVLLFGFASVKLIEVRQREEAEIAVRDATEKNRLAAEKELRLAEARETGRDLSIQERKVVGSWSWDRSPAIWLYHFHADRSWRLEDLDGKFTMSGTWQVENGKVLVQEVEENSDRDFTGMVIRSEIIELGDSGKMVIKDPEGNATMTLRPIHEMSDEEKSLLGGWQRVVDDSEKGDDLPFHTLRFFTDRTWKQDGSVREKRSENWKVTDGVLWMVVGEERFCLEMNRLDDASMELRWIDTGRSGLFERTGSWSSPAGSTGQAEAAGEPEVVGKGELSPMERELLGNWTIQDGERTGTIRIGADRTFQEIFVDGDRQQTMSGSWRRDGRSLVLSVEACSTAALIGTTIRLQILGAEGGGQVILREEGSDDSFVLRPAPTAADSQ